MPLLRDPIDEPQALSGSSVSSGKRFVKIFHPGYHEPDQEQYDPNGDVLISLPALDDGGIHHDTAHTACAILAANRWDGYFSRDRSGTAKVDPPQDGILREKSYFFCLPSPSTSTSPDSTDHPYPVIARFGDWRFPHDDLPPIWRRLQEQLDVLEHAGAGTRTIGNGSLCLDNLLSHCFPGFSLRLLKVTANPDLGFRVAKTHHRERRSREVPPYPCGCEVKKRESQEEVKRREGCNNDEVEEYDAHHDETSSDLDSGYCDDSWSRPPPDSWFSLPLTRATKDDTHGEVERGRTRKRKIDDTGDDDCIQKTTPENSGRPKRVSLHELNSWKSVESAWP
ncbi:hypothetical protein FPOAC2_07398 [Fusarium poae]